MTDFLVRLLFEDLWLLLLFEAIAVAISLAIYRRRLTRRSRIGVYVVLAISIVQIIVQHSVVTDREALTALVQTLAQAVEDGDVPTIADALTDGMALDGEYVGSVRGKEAVVSRAMDLLQRFDVNEAHISGLVAKVTGDTATVRFQSVADIRGGQDTPVYQAPAFWRLECVRTPDGWKVHRARSGFGFMGRV